MLGAEILVRSLVAGGIDLCLGNPGTSEMQFIAALDRVPGLRPVLTLFEGVATGAADGYARMTGRPAATLMHLGPGLANGLCNLHNARKARVPMVNIVGEHASHHRRHDTPLLSDVEGLARPLSDWVRTAQSASTVAHDCADAIAAALAPPGRIATLILPADTAWTDGGDLAVRPLIPPRARRIPAAEIEAAARRLRRGGRIGLMIGGDCLRAYGLALARDIAVATGCRVFAPMSNARIERGAGRVPIERVPFSVDDAIRFLAGLDAVMMIGAAPPAAFFAYPDKPSVLTPEDCELVTIATPEDDVVAALADLSLAVGSHRDASVGTAPEQYRSGAPSIHARQHGSALDAAALAAVVAARLPENAIVIDESLSLGFTLYPATTQAARHDWLQMAGGATGEGLPLAVGAALACPDRKVVCLQADGSGLYTCQALWTMAREGLDVTTIVLANRSYATLFGELAKVGATHPGPRALGMIRLDDPAIGWPDLARGFGVPGERAEDTASFDAALARALAMRGPSVVEAVVV